MARALMSQPEKAEEPTKRIEYASQGSKVRRDILGPITASATLCPFSLADCLSRGTEGGRRYLHGFQDRGKHGAGLLPEKPFRRGGAVRAREEEVVHRCQARTLSGMVKSSQLMVPQREVPVAPFHRGTGALEHLRERFGLVLELVLPHWAQLAQRPAGRKQRGAEALGQFTQRLAGGNRPRRGHALEIIRRDEMGMHGVGLARRQV